MSQPLPKPMPDGGQADTPPEQQGRGWLRAMLPVVMIAACAELGIAVLNNSALPVYFHDGLKIDMKVVALILVPFFISEVLFKSPLGILSDRLGRKPLMLFGALVTVFTPLILIHMRYHPGMATAVIILVGFGFLRLLDGLGQSAVWPSLFAYVGDVVHEAKRGAAMGLLNVVYMIGLAFGFLAGGFVDDTFGPVLTHDATFAGQMHAVGRHIRQAGHHLRERIAHPHHHLAAAAPLPPVPAIYHPQHYFPSFYLASVLFAIAAIVALLALPGRTPRHEGGGAATHAHDEKITWQGFVAAVRTVPQFLLLTFVTFFGIGCLVFVVKLFAMHEFGLPEKQVGLLMLGPALIIGAISVPVGHLADRWGKTRAVRLGFVLCTVGMWGIPVLHHLEATRLAQPGTSLTGFIFSASIMGIGFVLAFPAWMALITSLSSDRQRGTVLGAIQTAQGVGVLIGSQIGAALYERHPIAPFVASASLVTVGTILALVFVRESALCRRPAAP